jgi:hypothetical protein
VGGKLESHMDKVSVRSCGKIGTRSRRLEQVQAVSALHDSISVRACSCPHPVAHVLNVYLIEHRNLNMLSNSTHVQLAAKGT